MYLKSIYSKSTVIVWIWNDSHVEPIFEVFGWIWKHFILNAYVSVPSIQTQTWQTFLNVLRKMMMKFKVGSERSFMSLSNLEHPKDLSVSFPFDKFLCLLFIVSFFTMCDLNPHIQLDILSIISHNREKLHLSFFISFCMIQIDCLRII